MEELGHPERRFPVVLIAGTNGKGSVAAYVDAVFRGLRARSGRYTSPHLVRVHERITVGGRSLSGRALADTVEPGARRRSGAGSTRGAERPPTYFETITAAAFLHFAARTVDVAVVEVGLGGRLDATNVTAPIASAIVSIDYDHQDLLGHSLASIAAEKAGVLRAGRTTVVGPMAEEARAVVEEAARTAGARLVSALGDTSVRLRANGSLDLRTPSHSYTGLRPLPGAFQHQNLRVAVRLVEEARRAGLAIALRHVGRGIARTRWPGRLERVPGRPSLLLDGAHNPAGAQALAHELRRLAKPCVLLFGAMADKAVEAMAAELFPLATAVVLTAPRMPRAASPASVRARVGAVGRDVRLAPAVGPALQLARRLAGPRGLVVVAGSLYLVGAVKALLLRERL